MTVRADQLPMPLPGVLQSARVLSDAHLGEVAACAYRVAWCFGDAQRAVHLTPAWDGREETLLAYGLACLREAEHRGLPFGPAGLEGEPVRRAADQIVERLRAPQHQNARVSKVRPSDALVPGVLVRYRDPSWVGVRELHARHRAALLTTGTEDDRAWYAARGWRAQVSVEEAANPPDLSLPAHDHHSIGTRWQLDTAKDWGEHLVQPTYEESRTRRKSVPRKSRG